MWTGGEEAAFSTLIRVFAHCDRFLSSCQTEWTYYLLKKEVNCEVELPGG